MHSRKKTWLIGGIGLVTCGVIGVLRASPMSPPAMMIVSVLADIVWAAAVLIFAIGLSRTASVVGRRPLGVAAMIVVALWPLTVTIAGAALDALLPVPDERWMIWGYTSLLVSTAAGLICVVQISRSGVVPTPWNWAPMAAFGLQAIAWLVPQLLMQSTGSPDAQLIVGIQGTLGMLSHLASTFGLGIGAIVLATRARPESVEVYRSAATPTAQPSQS